MKLKYPNKKNQIIKLQKTIRFEDFWKQKIKWIYYKKQFSHIKITIFCKMQNVAKTNKINFNWELWQELTLHANGTDG